VVVNKEIPFIKKLQSQMQFKTFAKTRRHGCELGKSRVREWSELNS
jgi:hypothetical protein